MNSSSPRFSRRAVALGLLALVWTAWWADVLFTSRVLLPGEMLRGFAPWGSDPQAPWTILQWDALAQYFPWRTFAARELEAGRVPLWNPHQFAGAPFLANGQSAVFYPLSLPFWLLDTARAFAVAAWLHSLLAAGGAYALCRQWKCSRAASVVAATAFAGCGYLASWSALPTLAHTASWLPLLLWLFERACEKWSWRRVALVALALCCALLAGHVQVFLLLVAALVLRALTVPNVLRGVQVLASSGAWAFALSALQVLPTLELARLGHRAAQGGASEKGWQEIAARALAPSDLPSLLVSDWPMGLGSLNESFGFCGLATFLLALLGLAALRRSGQGLFWSSPPFFALLLAVCGLGTAMAWAPASWLYFSLPGASQFAGAGRALLWWNAGLSFLAAFGLDALRSRTPRRDSPHHPSTWMGASTWTGAVALLVLVAELGWNARSVRVTAERATIYPQTSLTRWLSSNLKPGERVVFVTPRRSWRPREWLEGRAHPPGVMPPNGAMVYGFLDVSGYDSLSPLSYRAYINAGEENGRGADVAPPLNGNMALVGAFNSRLDELNARYIVTWKGEGTPLMANQSPGKIVFEGEDCIVWQRWETRALIGPDAPRRDGRDFSPGWREEKYQPTTFRLGAFVSLCALALLASAAGSKYLLGFKRPV
jgi:hypothetical protein